jgi:hypothetical protein
MFKINSNTGRSFSEWAKGTNRQEKDIIEIMYKSSDLYEKAIASMIKKAAEYGFSRKNKIKKCVAAATSQAQKKGMTKVCCKSLKSNYTSNFKNLSTQIESVKVRGA